MALANVNACNLIHNILEEYKQDYVHNGDEKTANL